MRLEIPSICDDTKMIVVEEFTLEDFRSIAFMLESDSDGELYKLLISKVLTPCNSLDKFHALLHARVKFVNETIAFNNGTSNISINLNTWIKSFKADYVNIEKTIELDNFTLSLSYPEHFLYENMYDIVIECISSIKFKDTEILLEDLSRDDKNTILEKLPPIILENIKTFIFENSDSELMLMKSMLDLPEVSVNFFDNSAYTVIKTLYSYYTYDDILELIFMLSAKLPDIQYINSRNPRDLEFLIRLYNDEVAKSNQDDKSII
jgi:hypothetical protein|tara:strand:- start:8021 stop:8812 length:792 start_codon:yes stop_codon:yes gene_type:complete